MVSTNDATSNDIAASDSMTIIVKNHSGDQTHFNPRTPP
jgi:hypothetical protein